MSRILVFADDLTGTNDTAAMVHQYGYEAYTVVDLLKKRTVPDGCECLGINLDSRGRAAADAKSRLQQAFGYYVSGAEVLYSKRIDSTLRGHLGVETDTLRAELGGDRAAMIVPALPDAGRLYYGGSLYVNGILLQETAAAKDPAHPISTSSPLSLFCRQSINKTCEIKLAAVRGSKEKLIKLICDRYENGCRNLLFEAVNDNDIDNIATAVRECKVPYMAVDPGAFTCRLAAQMHKEALPHKAVEKEAVRRRGSAHPDPGILAVIGSVNQVSKIQMKQVMEHHSAVVSLDISSLINSEEQCEASMEDACRQILLLAETNNICILVLSSVLEADHTHFREYAKDCGLNVEEIIKRVNTAIAGAAARILKQEPRFGGVFTCGGDITAAVCQALKASVIRIFNEVIPLAVYGTLILENGSSYEMVTKGGMVGAPNDMMTCLEYLKKQI